MLALLLRNCTPILYRNCTAVLALLLRICTSIRLIFAIRKLYSNFGPVIMNKRLYSNVGPVIEKLCINSSQKLHSNVGPVHQFLQKLYSNFSCNNGQKIEQQCWPCYRETVQKCAPIRLIFVIR